MANRSWTAEVFVDSNVGTITANVQASCFSGAKQQIERIYGPVQQIVNLREVNTSHGSASAGTGGSLGALVLVGIGISIIGGIFGGGESIQNGSPSAPESAPVAPIERSYTAPATADTAPSRPLTYANPPGPCVTDNFEPC